MNVQLRLLASIAALAVGAAAVVTVVLFAKSVLG